MSTRRARRRLHIYRTKMMTAMMYFNRETPALHRLVCHSVNSGRVRQLLIRFKLIITICLRRFSSASFQIERSAFDLTKWVPTGHEPIARRPIGHYYHFRRLDSPPDVLSHHRKSVSRCTVAEVAQNANETIPLSEARVAPIPSALSFPAIAWSARKVGWGAS